MQDLIPFEFEGHAVRSTVIKGDPWFVAKDVCAVMGIANSRKALLKLDEDEKGVTSRDTPGGNQELAVINESGLYALIMRSRKATTPGTPQHRFRKWVTSEVLPTIRRTGGYSTTPVASNDFIELETEHRELERKYFSLLEKYVSIRDDALDEIKRFDRASKAMIAKLMLETNWTDDEIRHLFAVDKAYVPIVRNLLNVYGKDEFYERFIIN
ncbi:MAG: hypothetical protein HQL35_09175 [Alphaproteobacteria bacterium]|nr:hypothetical protein [Alphaproteobacteria bacterium]